MHILKCVVCGNYCLDNVCSCGAKTERVVPPRFSPDDKYAKYRRQAKLELENEKANG
ncbi:RNA-protein complex protein Nop10 [Candidatus Woesearchaeota archaeon]|nr:RNA-protein complex protein Nop10 [Candidatus Woesearchaeota archaeon]